MEGGLYQSPLPTVCLPLGAEKALAGKALGGLEGKAGKAAVMGDQHISDVVRVVQEIEMLAAKVPCATSPYSCATLVKRPSESRRKASRRAPG